MNLASKMEKQKKSVFGAKIAFTGGLHIRFIGCTNEETPNENGTSG
jgi:hypothetical protein